MRISDWSSDVCSSDLQQMGNLAKISDQPGQLTQWSEPLLPVKLNAAVESNESLFDLPVPAPHHRAALQAALDAGEPPLPSLAQVENMLGKLAIALRSEEHTYELQSLMRISYAV